MANVFEYKLPATITITNLLSATAEVAKKWNTGLNCYAGEAATVEDTTELLPEIGEAGRVYVRVFGNRGEKIVLKPGESAVFTATTDEQVLFYLDQKFEGVLKVEAQGAAA